MQFKGFSDYDMSVLKSFLADNDKKWFVAHLLDNLDTFSIDLSKPMLISAVNEPAPSFNNDFIKPCPRVYEKAEEWRMDYNCSRPHQSLGFVPPVAYILSVFMLN